jgi:hypothetical protein
VGSFGQLQEGEGKRRKEQELQYYSQELTNPAKWRFFDPKSGASANSATFALRNNSLLPLLAVGKMRSLAIQTSALP